MKNQLVKITALSLMASSVIYAGGYKIPETSVNGVALSAANVAHSHGADAAYYNPANMAFMEDENSIEVDMMFISLDNVKFKGSGSMAGVDISAESETFLIPSINYVSGKIGDARIGFSIVVPGGLTKRWKQSPAVDKAEEFTLSVIELNPTVAYPINDQIAVALGLRAVHSSGIVKSSSTASRDMEGESWDFGYNLALSYKPTKSIDLAVAYRSNVDLEEEGNAKLFIGNAGVYNGGSSVTVPLPALLNVAAAYTFETKTTIEFVYERNFWSEYSELDFNYNSPIPTVLVPSMDMPIAKDWQDTNTFRLGVTQEMDKLTLMGGIVVDETPIPESKVSFELPDSDSVSVSLGGRYQFNKSLNFGLSMLYSMRDDRTVNNSEIQGEFSNSDVMIVSAGVEYKF
jgi:long-chain fatty acid transport protein